ncbi:MAG: 50S ribosomal protein L18 [Candidatus Aenigmarchaeota archaeon]|nr:50S ribosomal protein L18 [Candidatus Aenigmarchaeota archaeon]
MINIQFRRRREKRTDYNSRLSLLRSGKTRLVVRKTLKHCLAQLVDYTPQGDKVVAAASSLELNKFGWTLPTGNLPAAYLTGFLCGLKAKGKVKDAILDIGLHDSTKGGTVYAVLKGVVDAGIQVPHDTGILPSMERISGKHIADYAEALKKSDQAEFKKRFASYLKSNAKPEETPKKFEEAKNAIKAKF